MGNYLGIPNETAGSKAKRSLTNGHVNGSVRKTLFGCPKCPEKLWGIQNYDKHMLEYHLYSSSSHSETSIVLPETLDQVGFLKLFEVQPTNDDQGKGRKSPRIRKLPSHRVLSAVEFSSLLGQKVLKPVIPVSDIYQQLTIEKYDKSCPASNSPEADTTGRLRSIKSQPFTVTFQYKRHKTAFVHKYCFNTWQKRDKRITRMAGLDRRGRRLLSLCKPASLILKRLPQHVVEAARNKVSIQHSEPPNLPSSRVELVVLDGISCGNKANDKGKLVIDLCSDSEEEHDCSLSEGSPVPKLSIMSPVKTQKLPVKLSDGVTTKKGLLSVGANAAPPLYGFSPRRLSQDLDNSRPLNDKSTLALIVKDSNKTLSNSNAKFILQKSPNGDSTWESIDSNGFTMETNSLIRIPTCYASKVFNNKCAIVLTDSLKNVKNGKLTVNGRKYSVSNIQKELKQQRQRKSKTIKTTLRLKPTAEEDLKVKPLESLQEDKDQTELETGQIYKLDFSDSMTAPAVYKIPFSVNIGFTEGNLGEICLQSSMLIKEDNSSRSSTNLSLNLLTNQTTKKRTNTSKVSSIRKRLQYQDPKEASNSFEENSVTRSQSCNTSNSKKSSKINHLPKSHYLLNFNDKSSLKSLRSVSSSRSYSEKQNRCFIKTSPNLSRTVRACTSQLNHEDKNSGVQTLPRDDVSSDSEIILNYNKQYERQIAAAAPAPEVPIYSSYEESTSKILRNILHQNEQDVLRTQKVRDWLDTIGNNDNLLRAEDADFLSVSSVDMPSINECAKIIKNSSSQTFQ